MSASASASASASTFPPRGIPSLEELSRRIESALRDSSLTPRTSSSLLLLPGPPFCSSLPLLLRGVMGPGGEVLPSSSSAGDMGCEAQPKAPKVDRTKSKDLGSAVASILSDYGGRDYLKYAKFNKTTYSKIKLPQSGKHFDMYLICWNPHQETKIHDHPEGGCPMMVLEGELHELGG